MGEIRTWFENYVMYQKLTDPEWNILRGIFTNKELRALERGKFRHVLSHAKKETI